mgnify:FL=1|jgi:hypothetical protein
MNNRLMKIVVYTILITMVVSTIIMSVGILFE